MRKIFGGSLVFSLVGAVVLGGVFAWTLSDTAEGEALVGEAYFQITWAENDNILGPNATQTWVGTGGAGAEGSDFDLIINDEEDHELVITAVSSGMGSCSKADFAGDVLIHSPNTIPAGTVAPTPDELADFDGETPNIVVFSGHITTLESAPLNCMGRTVFYEVTIFAEVGDAFGNEDIDDFLNPGNDDDPV